MLLLKKFPTHMEKSYLHVILGIFYMHGMLFCLATNSPSISTDQDALLALKNITLESNPTLAQNWTAASSVCEWIGVTCSSLHYRVTSLHISNMGLTGTLPPHLGNLSFLVSLDLSQNHFHGEVPSELAKLHRLKTLNFGQNNITGEIPPWICYKMSNLERLLLYKNSLQGTIPSSLSQCTRLQVLILSHNNLSGVIPTELGNLEKLQQLYLRNNSLTGAIPQELGKLTKLEKLILPYNCLTRIIPKEIGNLTMLQILYLDSNFLTGVIPEELGNLRNLEQILLNYNNLYGSIPVRIFNLSMIRMIGMEFNNLSGYLPSNMGYGLPNLEQIFLTSNNITGPIPDSISNSTKLKYIQIPENKLSGPIPESLGNLRFLQCLNLYSNNLTSNSFLNFIDSLGNCRNLEHLDLSDNPLNSILPNSFANLSSLIQRIRLRNCKIKGKIPNLIGNLSSLFFLDMYGNNMIGSVPSSIEHVHGLQALNLGHNKLVDRASLVNLCRLGSLFLINLSQNKISGSIPECLDNITSLRKLFLGSNELDSSIPSKLWNLKDLSELNLSRNFLSGSLPLQFGSLKAATFLDLSMNQISGGIPTTISGLLNVQYFCLNRNRFEGSIPESIGMILSLKSVDLSHNSLSGSIPRSLEKLRYLEYLNVSFNHLSGEIPSGGPFQIFTSASFDSNGNRALCGESKFHVPPCPRTMSSLRKSLRIIFISLVVGAITGVVALGFIYLRYRKKDKVPNSTDLSSPKRQQDRISYYELQQATDGYSETNLLGTGSFGSVYKGLFNDGKVLAIKVFNVHQENAFKSFEAECQVLRELHHRNLIKVISSCSNLDFKALVLEFMPNGNLDTWLHCPNYMLDIMQRLNIMIDVACALDYLHFGFSTPVVHCDMKPSNVLLDKDMVAHVSDFGITKFLGEGESLRYTQTLATFGYMAPEYGLEGSISTRCDVYSYGIMLMEVCTGVQPSNDMFGGNLCLRGWVKNVFPCSLVEVIDANILRPGEEYFQKKLESLSSIMEVALNCTVEHPKERSNIRDVLAALEKIKLQLST